MAMQELSVPPPPFGFHFTEILDHVDHSYPFGDRG
jgi:hypothetical protein